eukprot:scaffold2221_cov124-Cylindrotheca_fusiformis.AAC.1
MYQTLAQCAPQHVEQQLPTEKTRVQKLINAIKTTDAELHAKLANVYDDEQGKLVDFEATASYLLLPADPVRRKLKSASAKKDETAAAQISETSSATVSSTVGTKSSVGKSGVELHFHTREEYKHLNKDQRRELHQHRQATCDSNGKGNKRKNDSDSNSQPHGKKFKEAAVAKAVATTLVSKADASKTASALDDDFQA